jgi:hypothetical protein
MLRLLALDSGGVYRCEVSTEAPLFLTVAAQAHMLIMGQFKVTYNFQFIETNKCIYM